MIYTAYVIERQTGELVEVNKGNWVTVSELGIAYGVGRKRIRAVLHHMGLLRSEGARQGYRLAPFAVERGYGKRIDHPKNGTSPFDVISPLGQQVIAAAWQEAVADLELEITADAEVEKARSALFNYKDLRTTSMTTQEQVGWLSDHFGTLNAKQIAAAAGISASLATRYIASRDAMREALHRRTTKHRDNLEATSIRTWIGENEAGERISVTMPSLPSVDEVAQIYGINKEPAMVA